MKYWFSLFWLWFTIFSGKSQDFEVLPLQEVIFSVQKLEEAKRIYTEIFGFKIVHQGNANKGVAEIWNVSPTYPIEEILLQYPNAQNGFLRLVKFNNTQQKAIREGGQIWDTGGIYDIDLRVNDIFYTAEILQNAGFRSLGEPVRYKMGPFEVWETFLKGADDVVVALIERIAPPLENLPDRKGIVSPIFNVAQVVKDLQKSIDFFKRQLGFKPMLQTIIKSEKPEPNILNLPHNLAHTVPAHLWIASPNGKSGGSIELLQLEGLIGRDFSTRATPPNRGIMALRFEVKNIETYYQFVETQQTNITVKLQEKTLAPQGKVKIFAVQSPEGAWIEFYEKIN